jgi:hypothetical protein
MREEKDGITKMAIHMHKDTLYNQSLCSPGERGQRGWHASAIWKFVTCPDCLRLKTKIVKTAFEAYIDYTLHPYIDRFSGARRFIYLAPTGASLVKMQGKWYRLGRGNYLGRHVINLAKPWRRPAKKE